MTAAASHIAFVEYPRYILLLDWLLEKKILFLFTSPTHLQPDQSPEILLQLLSLLTVTPSLSSLCSLPSVDDPPSTLVPLAQVLVALCTSPHGLSFHFLLRQ
jgi:hypothetical protein